MRKLPLLLFGIAMIACHQSNSPVEKQLADSPSIQNQSPTQSSNIFNELKPLLIDLPEVFIIPAKQPQTIEGKKGLKISVDAENLETVHGKPVSGDVIVNMKEMPGIADMVANNCPTVSDGKILVSDGSYFIGMTCNGEELKVKKGKSIRVEFPKSSKTAMELFSGKRNADGIMNWTPINKKLTATDNANATVSNILPAMDRSSSANRDYGNADSYWDIAAETKVENGPLQKYEDSVREDRRAFLACNYKHMTQKDIRELMERPYKIAYNDSRTFNVFSHAVGWDDFSVAYYWSPKYNIYIVPAGKDSFSYYKVPNNASPAPQQKDSMSSLAAKSATNYDKSIDIAIDKKGSTNKNAANKIVAVKYYVPVEIESLGWINCDHFYDAPEGTVPQYTLNIQGPVPDNIGVYVIFKDIKSMLLDKAPTSGKNVVNLYENLPLNSKVDFVIYSKINNQFVECKQTALVTKNMVLPVILKPASNDQIKNQFLN